MPAADFCLASGSVTAGGTPVAPERKRGGVRGRSPPDKDVNDSDTTASFTLPPEPVGVTMWCWLARRLGLGRGFCSSARRFADGLPSGGLSRERPCLWLVVD